MSGGGGVHLVASVDTNLCWATNLFADPPLTFAQRFFRCGSAADIYNKLRNGVRFDRRSHAEPVGVRHGPTRTPSVHGFPCRSRHTGALATTSDQGERRDWRRIPHFEGVFHISLHVVLKMFHIFGQRPDVAYVACSEHKPPSSGPASPVSLRDIACLKTLPTTDHKWLTPHSARCWQFADRAASLW